MSTGLYSADAWLWPITIIEGQNDTIQIEEDGGSCVITITLEAGDWYLHDDDSFHTAGYNGLYRAIRYLTAQTTGTYAGYGAVAITGTKTNSYTWSVSTPSSSTSVTNGGLTLQGYNAVAGDSFIIDVSDSTMDMRWFGQLTATPSDPTSSGSGTTYTIASPGCLRGRWLPYNHAGAPCAASRKRPIPFKIVEYSAERPADSVANEWYSTTLRDMEYRWQMPGHVHENRAQESGYATHSGLATGDTNNAFHHVWDKLTASKACIVVHNSTSDLQVDANDYEVVKLHQKAEWEDIVTPVSDAGDIYRIALRVDAVAGSYNH